LFPIFATLLEFRVLGDLPDPDFHACLAEFPTLLNAHLDGLSAPDRVALVLLLANLVRWRTGLRSDRVETFVTELAPIVKSVVAFFFRPALPHVELLANRLATAKFDALSLIEDCQTVFQRAFASLRFTPEINQFLTTCLLADFQYRASTTILANPQRFCFSNSMVWNTAITAIQADLRLELPSLREVVLALNMAPAISLNPEIAKEICASVPVSIICFILSQFATDDDFPIPVDPSTFKAFYASQDLSKVVPLPEPQPVGFDRIRDLDLGRWNARKISSAVQAEFPYLAAHLNH
jgi:hypothetical protein